jgi:FHA domain/zinc-ribbon domain
MMRDCHQCGEPNQPSARFCVVCGAPLSAAAPAAAAHYSHTPQQVRAPLPPPPLLGGKASLSPALADAGAAARPLELPLDGPRVLVGFLVSFESVELGQYWPIHQGKNVVGRQGASGIEIEISHPTTSSLHAVLLASARPGRVLVEDTNSTNGTFVNDNALSSGQRWELRDGDRVRFGLFNTVVKVIESAPAATSYPGASA